MAARITASMADMTFLRFIEFDHPAGVVLTNAEPATTRACVHTRVWVPYSTCRILAPSYLGEVGGAVENERPRYWHRAFRDGVLGGQRGCVMGLPSCSTQRLDHKRVASRS